MVTLLHSSLLQCGILLILNGRRSNSLQVEQDASQKILDTFMENYKNLQSQTTFARPDAVIVSPAAVPVLPAFPGKLLLELATVVFSVSLALLAVLGVEMMKDVPEAGLSDEETFNKIGGPLKYESVTGGGHENYLTKTANSP